jgi:MinD-like ATPase involved in chromosome partitioning or flagellar assembly
MKIAVINFSGNVGKSTIARELLAPRMPQASVVGVETINADSASEHNVRGAQFRELAEGMSLTEDAIVDVGSSNVEQFLSLMRKYEGSHDDFDLYLVPVVPALKQQRDTAQCILELARMGVPAQKIMLVFNLIEQAEDFKSAFESIIHFAEVSHSCRVDMQAVIWKTDLFALIRDAKVSIQALVEDPTDYKVAIRQATHQDQKIEYAKRLSMQRLALGVKKNLDQVFERVMT